MIIIVDDDDLSLSATEEMVKVLGWETKSFLNPRDALEFIKKAIGEKIEIAGVLTDFDMPEMNGNELAHVIIKLDRRIQIVIYSGSDQETMFNIINKPMGLDELDRNLNKYFLCKSICS